MERKQRSLLGKDESDQYLAGLQEKFSKVCTSVHIGDSHQYHNYKFSVSQITESLDS